MLIIILFQELYLKRIIEEKYLYNMEVRLRRRKRLLKHTTMQKKYTVALDMRTLLLEPQKRNWVMRQIYILNTLLQKIWFIRLLKLIRKQ